MNEKLNKALKSIINRYWDEAKMGKETDEDKTDNCEIACIEFMISSG